MTRTTTPKVTTRQAQAALAAVRRAFRAAILDGDEGPKLIMDWSYLPGDPHPAIVWEEGPFEWAYLATEGGVDEEMAVMMAAGGRRVTERQPVRFPRGLYVECATAWALSLYPEAS